MNIWFVLEQRGMARPPLLRDVQILTLQKEANDLTLAPEDANHSSTTASQSKNETVKFHIPHP
jgi:hypothetical protein